MRLRAVFAAVRGLLASGTLTLTSVGRGASPSSSEKHGIKRIDRLLGNRLLVGELTQFFAAIADRILRKPRPEIIVDWTEVTVHRFCVLYAAVAFDGRAIPIYAETHPMRLLGNTKIEKKFLLRLELVVPKRCRPILVLDAGFRPMLWPHIVKLGWDFVVRVRKGILITLDAERSGKKLTDWIKSEWLYRFAQAQPRDLGTRLISRAHRLRFRVVLADHRSARARGPVSGFSRGGPERLAAQKARDPWLLITSLDAQASASHVSTIYKRRMQIEETLRDTKNPRFGWRLEHSGSRDPNRIDVLLLIGTIASLVAMLLGLAAEEIELQYRYQASTRRDRRVLSLFSLGRRILAAPPPELDCRISTLFGHLERRLA